VCGCLFLLTEPRYDIGLVERTQNTLLEADKITVTSMCRRRIAIVMRNLKMCESLDQATKFVRQGHVRIGPAVCLGSSTLCFAGRLSQNRSSPQTQRFW
jgi:ribosomal protein S4